MVPGVVQLQLDMEDSLAQMLTNKEYYSQRALIMSGLSYPILQSQKRAEGNKFHVNEAKKEIIDHEKFLAALAALKSQNVGILAALKKPEIKRNFLRWIPLGLWAD